MCASDTRSPTRPATFLRLKTRDYGECVQHIRASSKSRSFEAASASAFVAFNHYELGFGELGVSLVDLDCAGDFEIVKHRPDERYFFQFPLRGTAWVSGLGRPFATKPGEAVITGPSQQSHAVWKGNCSQLIIKVGKMKFEEALAAEEGIEAGASAPRLPARIADTGIAHYLKGLMALHLHQGDECPVLFDERVNDELGGVLMRMLTSSLHQSAVRGPQAAPMPYYVKRAREFIHRHAVSDVTVQDIVDASGTGERSLFYGFKRWCGTTPKAYLRDVRLGLARRELESNRNPTATVSHAAISAGFTCLSQFSRLYRQRYGEYPSETLKTWAQR